MALICPVCQSPLAATAMSLKEESDLRCQNCRAELKLRLAIEVSPRSSVSVPLDAQKILVAVEGEVTFEMIQETLTGADFTVLSATDERTALEIVRLQRPAVIIVDVGLTGVFGPLVENSGGRADLKGIKIILLSSIHNKAKYKREPDNLYGASDYLERHHIQDQLLDKVLKHIGQAKPSAASSMDETLLGSVVESRRTPPAAGRPAEVRPAEMKPPELKPKLQELKGDLAAHDAAKRLARLIISDIALYNQKKIEEGIRNNTLKEQLREELEEGLKLYRSRTPKEVLESANYFEEALMDFIQKQKAKMNR